MEENGQFQSFYHYHTNGGGKMYHYNKNYFDIIDTFDKAYWLGFIAADGNIRKDLLKLRIELNIQDIEHLKKFRSYIEGDMPIREWIRPNNHSCYIEINCKHLNIELSKYGIVPNKSLILDINWNLIPKDLYKFFIRGYFDGDGSLNCYTKRGYEEWELSFISTEKTLLEFQSFFNNSRKIFSCGHNFRFCYKSKKDILNALSLFYDDDLIYLDRKKEIVDVFLGSQRLPKGNLNG